MEVILEVLFWVLAEVFGGVILEGIWKGVVGLFRLVQWIFVTTTRGFVRLIRWIGRNTLAPIPRAVARFRKS